MGSITFVGEESTVRLQISTATYSKLAVEVKLESLICVDCSTLSIGIRSGIGGGCCSFARNEIRVSFQWLRQR